MVRATLDQGFRGYTISISRRGDCEQLHIEDQSCVRRNGARIALRPVCQVRRNPQLPLTSDFHAGDALIPSLDDLALAEGE